MFGGLDIKVASSRDEQDQTDPAPEPAVSAFSFLSGAAAAAPPAPSAFSFLEGDGDGDGDGEAANNEAASDDTNVKPSSGFSFMTAPASPQRIEDAKSVEPPLSAFSFMKSSPITDQAVGGNNDTLKEETVATSEAPASSFSFLSPPSSTTSAAPAVDPPPDIMSTGPTSNSLPPVGSGVVFGGAAVVKKKTIKKRTRGIKVGQGRTEPVPAPALPPRPISPVATTLEHQESGGKTLDDTQDDSTKDGALEAVRRAEEFMQKMQHEQNTVETFQAPTMASLPPEFVDETYEAAKAAAEEAEAQLTRSKRPFGLGWLQRKSGGQRENSLGSMGSGTNLSSLSIHEGETETSAAEKIRREQEDIKRAMTERHLVMQQEQPDYKPDEADDANQSHHSSDGILPVENTPQVSSQSSPWRAPSSAWSRPKTAPSAPSPPPNLKKAPKEMLQEMLERFEQSVDDALHRVAQLRQQRNMLLEERFVSLAKERLAIQQIAQAETQQTSAAEAEDFDLADRLAAVIDSHTSEKAELAAILENIGRALEQLEAQKHDVVGGVAACFETMQAQLEAFQLEQESSERKDDTESMRRFSTTARQLSAENERLQNDFKILERDEELMTEERKELELAIHEQTEDLERHRDEARGRLAIAETEIEELRKLLEEKETHASALRTEISTHESGISRVRVKFSRQLTRVEKKETSLKENRLEWEAEKVAYESLKTAHDAEVQEHSESLLAHDELMTTLKREIALSATFHEIVSKEIVFESENDKDEETDGDFAQLQADVVKCEAATTEGRQLVKATLAVLDTLEKEHQTLTDRIPLLEEEKKSAVARRDFKAAGKASKEIKDATARLHDCIEELTGDGADRKKAAEAELELLKEELHAKKAIAHEKEKEVGIVAMEKVAQKIKHIVETKDRVCGNAAPGTVQAVGALVLRAQLDALQREGVDYGAKFGGWEALMEEIGYDDEADTKVDERNDTSPKQGKPERYHEAKKGIKSGAFEKEERSPDEVDPARIERFKEVAERLKSAEESLEGAVAKEEYDEAAKLDEIFQDIKAELENLDLTDAELELVSQEDLQSASDVGNVETIAEVDFADTSGETIEEQIEADAAEPDEELDGHESLQGTNGASTPTEEDAAKDVVEIEPQSTPKEAAAVGELGGEEETTPEHNASPEDGDTKGDANDSHHDAELEATEMEDTKGDLTQPRGEIALEVDYEGNYESELDADI